MAAVLLRIMYFEIWGGGRGHSGLSFFEAINVWTRRWDLLIGTRKSSSGVEEPSLDFKLLHCSP